MNASHSLVLCLNTSGEQPTQAAAPLPLPFNAAGREKSLGNGKILAFPLVYMPVLRDLYLHWEHQLLV